MLSTSRVHKTLGQTNRWSALKLSQHCGDAGFQFAIPHRENLPAQAFQLVEIRFVPVYGALDLCPPVVRVGNRLPEALALMPMPKTTVDQNYGLESWQHDVGFSGQVFSVKAEPESGGMQRFANGELGRRVLRVHTRHDPAPRLFRELVRHGYASSGTCSNRCRARCSSLRA